MSALIGLISSMTPSWAVWGTGLKPLVASFHTQFPGITISSSITNSLVATLPGLFGDYPTTADVAPSAVFIAVYTLLALVYFTVFYLDLRHGHRFWLYFGLGFYCIFRMLGFALRLGWSKNVLNVNVAIASTVFAVVSVLYVNAMNLILAHRIFTFRHPETGNALWFNAMISLVYVAILATVIMGIVAQSIPNLYYLTQKHLTMCQQVTQVAGVLAVIMAFLGIVLIVAAYVFKPGSLSGRLFVFHKDPAARSRAELPITISPVWLERFSGTYLPVKGSQTVDHLEPALDFEHRSIQNSQVDLTSAIRVISARETPAGGFTNHVSPSSVVLSKEPSINTAVLIVAVTSFILTLAASFRCASVFMTVPRGGNGSEIPDAGFIFHNVIMYMTYGLMEVIVSLIYLVMRTDLRFYIPDKKLVVGKLIQLQNNSEINMHESKSIINDVNVLEEEEEKRTWVPVLVDNSSLSGEAVQGVTVPTTNY